MELLDEKDGNEEETAGAEAGVRVGVEEVDASAPADELAAIAGELPAQDTEPQATPEEVEEAGDDDDDPLSIDLMDIFESEEMVEPTIIIPGLQHLTMSEVASETESVLEDVRSRFLS